MSWREGGIEGGKEGGRDRRPVIIIDSDADKASRKG